MERRDFLKTSCYTGLASLAGASVALGQTARQPGESATEYAQRIARERALTQARSSDAVVGGGRRPDESATEYAQRVARERALTASGVTVHCHALWRYTIQTQAQKTRFDDFAAGALIPALNRAGIDQVGVFCPEGDLASNLVYMLLSRPSVSSMTDLPRSLTRDEEYATMATAFLQTSAKSRPYLQKDVQLICPLVGMAGVELPAPAMKRSLQLVTYECFDAAAEVKMIRVFNEAGIAAIREAGISPIFFGQTIAGENVPNLTCMLASEQATAHETAWKRLLAKPEYHVSDLVYAVTKLPLKPTAYSQI